MCKVFHNQWGAVLLLEKENQVFANTYKITKEKLNTAFLIESRLTKLRKGELVIIAEQDCKFSILVPLFLPHIDQLELLAIVCRGRVKKNGDIQVMTKKH